MQARPVRLERLVMQHFAHPEELASADKSPAPQDCSWRAKDPNPAAWLRERKGVASAVDCCLIIKGLE